MINRSSDVPVPEMVCLNEHTSYKCCNTFWVIHLARVRFSRGEASIGRKALGERDLGDEALASKALQWINADENGQDEVFNANDCRGRSPNGATRSLPCPTCF